jgi:hypothetical protein
MKTLKISCQSFKPVSKGNSQVLQFPSKVQKVEFLLRSGMKFYIKCFASCFAVQSFKDVFCPLISKPLNHSSTPTIYQITTQWYKKCIESAAFLFLPILAVGCISRAPTDCELDKRSGLYLSSFCEGTAGNGAAEPTQSASAANIKPNEIPVRSEPSLPKFCILGRVADRRFWDSVLS